jgi:hypothetical protein
MRALHGASSTLSRVEHRGQRAAVIKHRLGAQHEVAMHHVHESAEHRSKWRMAWKPCGEPCGEGQYPHVVFSSFFSNARAALPTPNIVSMAAHVAPASRWCSGSQGV